MYISCYYCNQVSLNLIPCDGCCYVMFCNRKCMDLSMSEGHNIECELAKYFEPGDLNTVLARVRLALRATLKIRHLCKSWKEFISVSKSFDCKDLRHKKVNTKFPILTNHSMIDYPYGTMFNMSFLCAIIIHFLGNVQSFLPNLRHQKQEALHAFSRVMMYLGVFGSRTIISSCSSGLFKWKNVVKLMEPDIGYFPFIGKLRHSCYANTMAVGLNNKIALIAVQPISHGTEITINNCGQYNWSKQMKTDMLFSFHKAVCNCTLSNRKSETELSIKRKICSRKLHFRGTRVYYKPLHVMHMLRILCELMTQFSEATHSMEYKISLIIFRKCIMSIQNVFLRNELIEFKTKK